MKVESFFFLTHFFTTATKIKAVNEEIFIYASLNLLRVNTQSQRTKALKTIVCLCLTNYLFFQTFIFIFINKNRDF